MALSEPAANYANRLRISGLNREHANHLAAIADARAREAVWAGRFETVADWFKRGEGELLEGGTTLPGRANIFGRKTQALSRSASRKIESATTAKEVAQILAKDAPESWMREIARRCADRIDSDVGAMVDAELTNLGSYDTAAIYQRADYAGKLDREYVAGMMRLRDASDPVTAIHELVHATSASLIERWKTKRSEERRVGKECRL